MCQYVFVYPYVAQQNMFVAFKCSTSSHVCPYAAVQLRILLYGPGAQTGSPNWPVIGAGFSVLLLDQRKTDGLGCMSGRHTFHFDDEVSRRTYDCCYDRFDGSYKPEGRLDQFIGQVGVGEWTLAVQVCVCICKGMVYALYYNFTILYSTVGYQD